MMNGKGQKVRLNSGVLFSEQFLIPHSSFIIWSAHGFE